MWSFIAQLLEHRTGIAEVTGSNPVEALIFFRLLLSNCLNWKFTARIILHSINLFVLPVKFRALLRFSCPKWYYKSTIAILNSNIKRETHITWMKSTQLKCWENVNTILHSVASIWTQPHVVLVPSTSARPPSMMCNTMQRMTNSWNMAATVHLPLSTHSW